MPRVHRWTHDRKRTRNGLESRFDKRNFSRRMDTCDRSHSRHVVHRASGLTQALWRPIGMGGPTRSQTTRAATEPVIVSDLRPRCPRTSLNTCRSLMDGESDECVERLGTVTAARMRKQTNRSDREWYQDDRAGHKFRLHELLAYLCTLRRTHAWRRSATVV